MKLLMGIVIALSIFLFGGCRQNEWPWKQLAACESSGDWYANTGNGFEGGLQFKPSTWLAYKDDYMPYHAYDASSDEQITVAERVQAAQGWGAWPSCSKQIGLT